LSAAGWSLVPQTKGFNNSGIVGFNALSDIQFSSFNGASNYGMAVTDNFAIVVTFAVPTTGTQVVINSISCVPGDIATPPAPQTASEVLRECQYYYEKSYALNVVPATPTTIGSVAAFQNSELTTPMDGAATLYQDVINLQFKQVKRIRTASIIIYSVNGVLNDVTLNLTGFDSGGAPKVNAADVVFATYWTVAGQSDSSVYYTPVTALLGATLVTISPNATQHFIGTTAWAAFQYVIDARLGIV
jgi:hypothetical protein